MSILEISDKEILSQAKNTMNEAVYSVTEPMLEDLLRAFPENKESYQIAVKVLLLDKLYSTQLFRYKGMEFLMQIVENIRTIPDFDERVASGDPTVVCEIYRGFDKKQFSFASKYCCLHNTVVYSRDDYSIYDSTVHKLLPKYARQVGIPLTGTQIERWKNDGNYQAFNDAVSAVLDKAGITSEGRKRKFDLFLWAQR